MYGKIFDITGNPLCYQVSHLSSLVYTALIYGCDSRGIAKTQTLITSLNLEKIQLQEALSELEELNKIELFVKIDIYGRCKYATVLVYQPSEIINRVSQHEWSKLRNEVFLRDDYTCQYCGVKGARLECDHVLPISRGGTNEIGNLSTACSICNKSKRDKLINEWRLKNVKSLV